MNFTFIPLLLLYAAALPQMEATTLEDQSVAGELVALTAQSLSLRTADGDVTLPLEKLLSLAPLSTPGAAEAAGVQVELLDGTLVSANDYQVQSGRATIKLPGEKSISLSAAHVRSVRFLQQDEKVAALWRDIASQELKGDAVVVRKEGDGKPVRLDFLEGVIQDVSPAAIAFNFEGDVVPVNRTRVQVEGLIYFKPNAGKLPPAVCRVSDARGDGWMAAKLQLDGEELQISTPTGVEISLPLADVANMDFSLGKIVYLSDLVPIKKTWQPYLGIAKTSDDALQLFDVRRDENFAGQPLVLGESTFRKGLALHSRSELAYRLPDAFSRLVAVVGIDPGQRNLGHVELQILGDGKELLKLAIDGEEPPAPVELDISGVGRLTILVDYGQGLDIGDQLILGGARVIR